MKYWLLNISGRQLTESQLQEIPYPKLELTTHVTLKLTQTFGILGAALVAPVTSYVKKEESRQAYEERSFKYAKCGFLLGIAAAPVLTYLECNVTHSRNEDEIRDLCYQIRCHKDQLRVDRLSVIGTLVGLGAAHHLAENLTKGMLYGFFGGCVSGGVVNLFLRFW